MPQVNAGNDLIICQDEEITLLGSGADSYTWSNGIVDGVSFSLQSTQILTLTGTTNGCSNTDQVTITVLEKPIVSLGNDIELCANNLPYSLTAFGNQNGLIYSWNNGLIGATINATNAGLYIVTATNNFGCLNTDTLNLTINQLPSVAISGDLTICSNELPSILSVQSSNTSLTYQWSSGQTTQQIQVSQAGLYSVSVTDVNGCESSDEVQIQVLSSPNVNAGNDITVCDNDFPVKLNATGNGATVQWSNGSSTPFTSVSQAGTYFVTTTGQNGCSATDSVIVIAEPCVRAQQ